MEYERWQQYLDTPTRKPLISIVEQQLLAAHMPALLEKGFDDLMAQKRSAMLHQLCCITVTVRNIASRPLDSACCGCLGGQGGEVAGAGGERGYEAFITSSQQAGAPLTAKLKQCGVECFIPLANPALWERNHGCCSKTRFPAKMILHICVVFVWGKAYD